MPRPKKMPKKSKTMIKMIATFTVCSLLFFSSTRVFGQPKINFDSLEYTMNTVKLNEKAALKIPFKNSGNEPLIITSAQGTGTSSLFYPKEPILPKKTGFIEFRWPAQFVTKTKQRIFIRTNVSNEYITLTVNIQVINDTNTDRIVSGVVKDNSGVPIPFSTVSIKETNKAAQTDFDGNFSIYAKQNDTLIFQSVGYKLQQRKADTNKITVQLQEINELAVEYGPPPIPRNKLIYSMSIEKVSAKDIENIDNPKYNFNKSTEKNVFVIFVSELTSYDFGKEDLAFQQKYNVKYSLVGNRQIDYLAAYNKLTFKYLNKKFKKAWQKEIRKDAVGLDNCFHIGK
jgi:hypothetical protein